MKKKIILLTAVVICLAILATGTLAYFTDEDTAHNVITTGAVNIQIEEWYGEVGTPYPEEPIAIMPGAVVSKIVTVRNDDAESWIRARFVPTVYDAAGNPMDLSAETLWSILNIELNARYWQEPYESDGWFYYIDPVATGAATEPLFTEVVFDGANMTNEYQNCTVVIDVYAQAVQTANNGAFALEAEGWPAE